MEILILGIGCPKCQALEKVVKEVVEDMKIDTKVSHIYDIRQFVKYGVRITPALIIDNKVVLEGKVPSREELKNLMKNIIKN
ncbi:MAG: thioredoxin family protein [Candidatus Omnitrophica bacterium]|nr:thioredoxin family protein [Candidatus Omnitrophota bacterium]MCM8809086.1 thioredoxin family protein [Candidatus Omnitrophota bacterium]MCM8810159.1 thioredoxin family protein [Candidatus Omnitrophota bacterium]